MAERRHTRTKVRWLVVGNELEKRYQPVTPSTICVPLSSLMSALAETSSGAGAPGFSDTPGIPKTPRLPLPKWPFCNELFGLPYVVGSPALLSAVPLL